MMLKWEQSLAEELNQLTHLKNLKIKRIEELRDEVQRDCNR